MQTTCLVLIGLGLAFIPHVEPACVINIGGTSTTVEFGESLVANCNTYKCETVNGVTALHLQGTAQCQLSYSDGSTVCFAAGTTESCFRCHHDPNSVTNPIYTTRECASGNTCVSVGAEVDHRCGRAVCNGATYAMDIVAGSKTECYYNGQCVGVGEYTTIPYNDTLQYNCTCQNVTADQLACSYSYVGGSSSGSQSCSFVDGPTVAYGDTTTTACNTYICETRNEVTKLYIQGQAYCNLIANGESTCLQAGTTTNCVSCDYDESDPATAPSVTFKCTWEDECVADGESRVRDCATYQCSVSGGTRAMQMVEKTECYFNGSCIAPGTNQNIEGYGDCSCTDVDTNAVTCASSSGSTSIQCTIAGQTITGGETVYANCNTYICETRNGVSGAYIQGQAYCSVTYSNGTQACQLEDTTQFCATCNYDETNTENPFTVTQNECYFNGLCVAPGTGVVHNCASYTCNGDTFEMDDGPDSQCNFNGMCIANGESATIEGHGNCTCTDPATDTLTCSQEGSTSGNCTFNGETVAPGQTEISHCNTYRCEVQNGDLGMYLIGEAYCELTASDGTKTCLAADETENCITCHYDADHPTQKFSITQKCALGDGCLAAGEEGEYQCRRYTCNGATYGVEEVSGSRTKCIYQGTCLAPGEYQTFDAGNCTCSNVDTNALACLSLTPCVLSNGNAVALGTTVYENCNNWICETRNGVTKMYKQAPGYCQFSNGYCLEAGGGATYYCYICHFNAVTAQTSVTRQCTATSGCIAPGQVGTHQCGSFLCNESTYTLELQTRTSCWWSDDECTPKGQVRTIGSSTCNCTEPLTSTFTCIKQS